MKPEHVTPVIVALVAAAASVGGILYNQVGALNLEREKWHQTVKNDQMKIEREAIAQFAKDFSASFYLGMVCLMRLRMCWWHQIQPFCRFGALRSVFSACAGRL